MRYLSHYQEYPIYEPAEGGYYYPGNELVNSSRMSKRACRREFDKIWEQCQKENVKNGFEENTEDIFTSNNGVYPWCRIGDNYIFREGYYVGEGESYTIERKQGSQRKGWHSYK